MSSDTTNQRINFASTKNPLAYPDFLEVQLKSFQDFCNWIHLPKNVRRKGCIKYLQKTFLLPTQEIILFLSFWITILIRRVIP
jgi:DNA-directed RNA polymerase subunit beta